MYFSSPIPVTFTTFIIQHSQFNNTLAVCHQHDHSFIYLTAWEIKIFFFKGKYRTNT